MANRKKKPKQKSRAVTFAEALETNEQHMGEMAAMAVTCEQFGITEDQGYELLISIGARRN